MKVKLPMEQGSAVIITLAFLVMISIVVIAQLESTRIDRPAAQSHYERMRAGLYAQAGVEKVVATLGQFTSGNSYWISQPGQLVVRTTANGAELPVPLHSGAASALSGAEAHLNIATLRDPASRLIADGGNSMPVQWIQVLADGTPDRVLQYDSTPPDEYRWKANSSFLPTAANPIVGRFAYWADDESSKINYNTAWGRRSANATQPGSPTQIDLTALTSFSDDLLLTPPMADALYAHITHDPGYSSLNKGFFNTLEDARRVEADSEGIAAILEKVRFSATYYNHTPNTTFFNEPRFVLTTRPDRAGWTYQNGQWVGTNGLTGANGTPRYIRILANEGSLSAPTAISGVGANTAADPGLASNLDSTKAAETVEFLKSYLKRTSWPMVEGGSSFQTKYYPVGAGKYPSAAESEKRLAQLAINIIDYVRSKESSQSIVEPFRGRTSGSSVILDRLAFDSTSFMGVARSLSITELGIWYGDVNGTKTVKLKAELYLPPNYGCSEVNLSGISIFFESPAINNAGGSTDHLLSSSSVKVSNSSNPDNPLILRAGTYAVVTVTRSYDYPTEPADVQIRAGLWRTTAGAFYRLDMTPLNGYQRAVTRVIPGVGEEEMPSIEVDDPRVNKHHHDWKAAEVNTFGRANSCSSIGKPPLSVLPQQDTNATGTLISSASLYMPPPAGTGYTDSNGWVDDNTLGIVTSVGELGYIHTGIETSASSSIPVSGTPWRTLRLQPNGQPATVVPDWALLDLFTVPSIISATAKPVFNPHGNAYGGRINLNSVVIPFAGVTRTEPLIGALLGARPAKGSAALTLDDAKVLASNIESRTTATHGKLYDYPQAYYSAGELVEIEGIADRGEESEQMIREIASHFTTRSNVFSIYTVGQALKQSSGGFVVTGEQRLHVLLERYIDPNGTLRIVPVYYRKLVP